jgi:hypothetical protein
MRNRKTSRLEAGLFRDRAPARALWVALALIFFLTAGGNAQEASKKPPKAAKPAKSSSKKPGLPVQSVLEPKAVDLLKSCSSRLASAKAMSFTVVISYESPSRLGPPLIYTTRGEVTMQRPDKLRVITSGDGPVSEFYYNGKTMTGFAPAENLVAVAEAPPTIDAMVHAAYDLAAIYFPFAPMIAADPYAIISEGLTQAFHIGQSRVIGGTTTDMVGIVNKWVFEQIWIGAEDKLPRMARAIFHGDPAGLRHQIEFSNWQIDPDIPAEAFASAKAAAAMPIPFDRPDIMKFRKLPKGVKPPGMAKPPKAGKDGAS